MLNRGGSDKLEKSPEEDHLQDVSSDQEDMNTTPSAPFQGGKNARGGGVPIETSKKRANPDASSSSTAAANHEEPGKKRQVDCSSGQHKCQTCGRPFRSLKGVHGHMRMHKMGKEKATGALPPPAFTHPSGSSPDRGCPSDYTKPVDAVPDLATVLLNSAQQVPSASVSSSASASAFRYLVIDLNISPPPEERDRDDGDSINVDINCLHEKEGRFDLNKSPPPEEDDGDNMKNN